MARPTEPSVPTDLSLRLAELMCARLCHDLSGPLGTVGGALELAGEAEPGAETREAMAAAREGAEAMRLRLRLLRAAWGGESEASTPAHVAVLAEALACEGRVALDFSGLDAGRAFAPAAVPLVLNVLMLAVEALGGRGRVALAGAPDGDVSVTVAGPRAAWPVPLAACIAEPARAAACLTGPRAVLAPLVVLLARAAGAEIALGRAEGGAAPPPLLLRLPRGFGR
jgi:histidine phosphotransferase ChpT